MESKSKCGVAFVGAGYMTRLHIPAFQDIPGVEVLGIHSRTRTRAETVGAEFGISATFASIDELYEETRADLVVIAVPELAANGVARACFEHPWAVLIEKPAGYNLADSVDIEAAARAKSRRAFVALNRRHYSSTRVVLNDLTSRSGSRLICIQDQEDPARALQAGQPQTVVNNWMYANSIHLIDYFRLLGRGPVQTVTPIIPWTPDMPRHVAAQISFESGDVGIYQAVWRGPGPWAVSVNTPEIRWEMRPLERAFCQLDGQRKLEPVPLHEWDERFKPGLRTQAELAIAAAQGISNELPTLTEGLETMRLIHAIYHV